MKKLELSNCPKHTKQIPFRISQTGYHFEFFNIHCTVCGKNGPKRKTINGAIKAWNKLMEDNSAVK